MDTQKPRYIVDVSRLRQKVYSLYLSGSPQRDAWIQAEKDYYYERALKAYQIISSSEVTNFLRENSFYIRLRSLLLLLVASFGWVLLSNLREDAFLVKMSIIGLLSSVCIYLGIKIYTGVGVYFAYRKKVFEIKKQLELYKKQAQKLLS